jgi:hypothetical protein
MFSVSGRTRLLALGLIVVLCALLTGCAKSKVTKENYDKIETGMSLDEVEAILGQGKQVGDGSMIAAQAGVDVTGGARPSSLVEYIWESGTSSITVTFRQDKVTGKRNTNL